MLLYHIKYFDNLVGFLWNESILSYFICLKNIILRRSP